MDVKQGREVVERYRSLLCLMPQEEGPFDKEPTPQEAISHVNGMLDRMDTFLDLVEKYGADEAQPMGGAWDKFNRWLGFVQGAFWFHGDYTLDMMRDHNRSNTDEKAAG